MLKKIVNDGIFGEFWISNVYIFQNPLIKSLIHKIKKNIKISIIF